MANWIHDIEIKNFKSIRQAKIEDCRRVNVFIGYPNVGKSNILEAIGLLTFIRERRPSGIKGLVRLEKLSQLYHIYNIQEPSVIKVNNKYVLEIEYEDEQQLSLVLDSTDKKNDFEQIFRRTTSLKVGMSSLISGQTNGIDDFSGWVNALDKLNIKPYKFSFQNKFDKNISARELDIPYGENMFEVVIHNQRLKNQFAELLKQYGLKLIIDASDNTISVTSEKNSDIVYTMPFSLLADTLIRLLFFKAALYSSTNSVLLFEEPETHMFPPYISRLTSDVIHDENNNQFFIATHSPFVLNDFMEDLKDDELSIYVVGFKKETGETIIRRLTDEEITEVYQYGIDLFFNLETFLKDAV